MAGQETCCALIFPEQKTMKPASEERIIAALAHLSALALGIGMVVPAILWTSQREKSKYAAFQSLQA
jgi:uncharacterized Tic20 family protein